MTTIAVVLIATVVARLVGVAISRTSASDLPAFVNEDVASEERISAFVVTFIERDPQARQLFNLSNLSLFSRGYRPKIGVPHDPEAGGYRSSDLKSYFSKKLYLDLSSIRPLNHPTFQSFADQIGRWADQTIINVEGHFNFEAELAKIPVGPEREEFKNFWLNDAILGTELRMLAWVHMQLFNTPYVNPEKR